MSARLDKVVVETCQFLKVQFSPVEASDYRSSTCCAEVNGKI